MKKIISLVLVLSTILGIFSSVFGATFKDTENTKYVGAVDALVELKVINGFPDGSFKPNQKVTRAELAKMLVITLGLESAANLAKGPTRFIDVASDHWAAGYINVATQNGIIIGYPDGTFLPEGEVTYAEAITMVVRALGYKNVVEVTGTWPTNYMQKAVELELLKELEGVKGDTEAIRGEIAVLIWNMLRTEMWAIYEENASTGVTYAKGDYMLNVKFPDYTYYDEVRVSDVDIEDTKINVTLVDVNTLNKIAEGEMLKGDFLTIYGRKVSALYSKKAKAFVVISPIDTAVFGKITNENDSKRTIEIDGKEYKYANAADMFGVIGYNSTDYINAVLDSNKIIATTMYYSNNYVVETVKEVKGDYKVNGNALTLTEDNLVLYKGSKVEPSAIKVGDVITKLQNVVTKDVIYVLTREKVEGTITKYIEHNSKDYVKNDIVVVDGDEYYIWLGGVKYFENEEEQDLNVLLEDKDYGKALKDKEIVVTLDCFGEVVKMEVGEIDKDASSKGFYVVTSEGSSALAPFWEVSNSKGSTLYLGLIGVNGEEEYIVNKVANASGEIAKPEQGDLVYIKFNSKDEIISLEVLTSGWDNGADAKNLLTALEIKKAKMEKGYISSYKVSNNVIVYNAYKTQNVDGEEELVFEVNQGLKALSDLDNQDIIVVYGEYDIIHYVLLEEEFGSKDLQFGIVEKVRVNRLGDIEITISNEDNEEEIIALAESEAVPSVGSLIAYKLNSQNKMRVITGMTKTEIGTGAHAYVQSIIANGRMASIEGGLIIDLDRDDIAMSQLGGKKLSDFLFGITEVKEVSDGKYEFESFQEVDLKDLRLKKYDRISIAISEGIILVIRGMEAK